MLAGLRGDNPLSFMAALGALRVLALAHPEEGPQMSWAIDGGAWRPVLHLDNGDPNHVVSAIEKGLRDHCGRDPFSFADNTCIEPEKFRQFAVLAATTATACDRRCADFAVAFGCEVLTDPRGKIQDTSLRTMSGAGHQHFLRCMRNVVEMANASHIRKALFEQWRYDDPIENLSMRWDPADDRRHALRWRDPSGDPARKKRGSVLGANRLAIEALPLFVTAPVGRSLETTGFRGRRWRWPIWEQPASTRVVGSLLTLGVLHKEPLDRSGLHAIDIAEVYESRRLTIGKIRNFAPARSAM
jgi:hypothetical protein